MFTSLTVVSFFFVFAWIQQIFLDRLIKDDLQKLQQSRRDFSPEEPDTPLHPTDS